MKIYQTGQGTGAEFSPVSLDEDGSFGRPEGPSYSRKHAKSRHRKVWYIYLCVYLSGLPFVLSFGGLIWGWPLRKGIATSMFLLPGTLPVRGSS